MLLQTPLSEDGLLALTASTGTEEKETYPLWNRKHIDEFFKKNGIPTVSFWFIEHFFKKNVGYVRDTQVVSTPLFSIEKIEKILLAIDAKGLAWKYHIALQQGDREQLQEIKDYIANYMRLLQPQN